MTGENEILFGGFGPLPPKLPEFKKPEGRPLWVEALEASFAQLTSTDEGKQEYGDPQKGATLEQAWRASGLYTGKLPICLVSTDKPTVPTDAIDRVIKMDSRQLVDTLVELYAVLERAGFPIFYHDGYMGHSVTLMGYDREKGRFLYHDPWPGDSLLTRDYNAAGVDAQWENPWWSITPAELERVILACFVLTPYWLEYLGEKYWTTYDELKASDFWEFFHITEANTEKLEDGNTRIQLRPGGFQSEIELSASVNGKSRLVEGSLAVKRAWIISPESGLNPFAVDIASSFIGAFAPPPDQDTASELIGVMRRVLRDPAYAQQLLNEGPEKSGFHKAVFTFLGHPDSVEWPFQLSTLEMNNAKHDEIDWLEMKVTTDAL